MKTLFTFFISALALLLFSACSDKPNYVHVEPEAHAIAAGGSTAMPMVIDEERSRGNLVIKEAEDEKYSDISKFINKYHAKKKPKLIIYVNKELNEGVSFVGSEIRITEDGTKGSNNWLMQAVKTTSQNITHAGYFERFMEKVEKGYISTFLDSEVKVIDRSYLLRNQELKYDKKDARKAFSVLEMDALKSQASLFISVVPVFSKNKIEIDVKAINLSDGQILVDYTADMLSGGLTKEIVLTKNGYEVVTKAGKLDKIMERIAKESMSKIGKTW
ncbi:hypothetical protein N9A28_03260 [Sulfurimonas sp.]|nr:hypothetical protein [Sulfurimonas sp.]